MHTRIMVICTSVGTSNSPSSQSSLNSDLIIMVMLECSRLSHRQILIQTTNTTRRRFISGTLAD